LLNLDQDHVLVAIGVEFFHPLDVAGFFAFHPELASRTAPVSRLLGLKCVLERISVHEREHQDLAGGYVLSDAGDETICAKFGLMRFAEFDFSRVGTCGKGHD
jgi:hypothetical protein